MIHGVRPAYILSDTPSRTHIIQFLRKHYPSINFHHRNNMVMFFNNGQHLENFTKEGLVTFKSKTFENHSVVDFDHKQVGIYLGYPEIAAQWFINQGRDIRTPRSRVHYHGLHFVCGYDMAEECALWMIENRPVPEEIRTFVSYRYQDDSGIVKVMQINEENMEPLKIMSPFNIC